MTWWTFCWERQWLVIELALRQVSVGHHMEQKACMVNVCARPGRKEKEALSEQGRTQERDSGWHHLEEIRLCDQSKGV